MKCRVCGSTMRAVVTQVPFKLRETCIVVVKDLPVIQCSNCSEYLLEDPIMARVDQILSAVEPAAEFEVVRFAA